MVKYEINVVAVHRCYVDSLNSLIIVLKELGRQIGRFHRFAKKFEEIHPIRNINDWHQNEEYAFLKYIPEEEITIRDAAQEVLIIIKNIPKDHSIYGLLHNDLWFEDILVDHNFVDFQNCEKNFYIFDLAVPIESGFNHMKLNRINA